MSYIELPSKNFREITKRLGYKRRSLWVQPAEFVTLSELNWSGGTKSIYTAVRLADFKTVGMEYLGNPAPWDNKDEGRRVPMKPGFLLVKTGFFCGKESLMTIYVHPENMSNMVENGYQTKKMQHDKEL